MSLKEKLASDIAKLSHKELLHEWEELRKMEANFKLAKEAMQNRLLELVGEEDSRTLEGRKIIRIQGARYSYQPETIFSIVEDTDAFINLVTVNNKAVEEALKEDWLDGKQKGRIKNAKICTPTKPFIKVIENTKPE